MDDKRKFDQDWQIENQEDGNREEQLQRGKFSKLKWKKKQEKKADKIDKGSKKKKQKTKAAIAVVLVAAIAAGGVFTFRSKGKKTQASGSLVMESKVQKGNLSQTVEGTGTLENADSTDLKIPAGLKIKKVKVSEGDEVKKGDTLATVDRTSLLAALAQTQTDLDDVNNQLGDEADSDTSKYVESSVDGRVKKIYASKNTDAADTVLEKGALMLISLDGKMAVKMDTTVSLTVGQEVKVVLSSGSSVTGTVTKSDDEFCTITVTDKGTKYNDKVTAYTSSGTKIGTGKLYINKEAKVTATSGTVSSILVSENEYVSEGDNLIKLKGDFQSEEYLSLESEKEDLEEKLASLLKIAKNNTITADSAGIITEINVSEDSESGSASDSSSSSSSSSSSGSSTGNSSSAAATGTSANVSAATTKTATNTLMNNSKTANIASASYLSSGNGTSGTTGTIKAVSLSTNQSQATQLNVQSVSEYSTDTTENAATITESTNTTDTTENTESSSETTTAKKSDTSSSTTITKSDTAKSDSTSSSTSTNNNQSGSTEKSNSSASTESTKNTTGSQTTNGGSSGNSKNSDGNTGTSGTMNGNGGNGISGASGSGAGSTAGVSGNAAGNSASAGTSSDSSSASSSTSSDTNTELTSAFSIAAGDEMTLSVNVDEMDILSIETGQKATVTFDAIENKEYEGEITSIDKNGTTSNGTTKYPVEITLTKEDSMMSGMNASVTITTSEVSDALLVPAAAVTEEGNTSYVYTEKDSKTGELSGKTEVQTGDTDGTNIVITSGVSEGDTVYYSMAAGGSSDDSSTDNQNNDQNRKDMKMDGSFGGGQGGGNGGGTPPSGGPGGNN
nr:biotin/lipoyl-binding protein [uncultured Anaerobutyricum sp.]